MHHRKEEIITQAVRPGFKFGLSVFFSCSVKNRRLVSNAHASPVHAIQHMEFTEAQLLS